MASDAADTIRPEKAIRACFMKQVLSMGFGGKAIVATGRRPH
jgi:hypothetical protein